MYRIKKIFSTDKLTKLTRRVRDSHTRLAEDFPIQMSKLELE